ncbi:MAG: hypothetical protein ACQETO_06430 [Pseudomonadota bacterium]
MDSGTENHLLRVQGVQGYLPGWRQPAVVLDIRLREESSAGMQQSVDRIIRELTDEALPDDLICDDVGSPTMETLISGMLTLLHHGGWPLFHPAEAHRHEASPDTVRLILPSVQSGEPVIHAIAQRFLTCLKNGNDQETWHTDVRASLQECIGPIRGAAPEGINMRYFLEAADRQRIPWFRMAGNLYQFGWGSRARWLDSSFTDATPLISARVARDKRLAARVLRQSGIPVPAQRSAGNLKATLAAAHSLGFPVVVKPASSDGGRGVQAFLCNDEEVREAFEYASQVSRTLIVEEHVSGNDYRIQVIQGQARSASQRIPAGVTGDGVSSVRELVEIANADSRRGPTGTTLLQPIRMDEEAHRWLRRQSLTVDGIPATGQSVRLRGAANLSTGGRIKRVLELAHPDNLRLAERAARILRLDIAGVDLLIPDIGRSWRETGAAICEVNAQPQMAADVPGRILQSLVCESGRIPVIMVIGGEQDGAFQALVSRLSQQHSGVGVVDGSGVSIDGHSVLRGPADSVHGARFLIRDPCVEWIAVHVHDAAMLRFGVPFDRIDHLVIASAVGQDEALDSQDRTALVPMLSSMATQSWSLEGADPKGGNAGLEDVLAAILQTR